MRTIHRITFLIIFCSSAAQLFAQNFYNKPGTTVSILEGVKMSVSDTLINNGTLLNSGKLVVGYDVTDYLLNTGILLNDDSLVVGGTWLNQGEYDPGNGVIMFNSTNTSIPQIINHNNQSFSRLVISGGGLKQILADLTVEESLTLTDGIITAQNGAKVHFSSTAIILGGSDEAHINAPVYQQGTGTKLFPVGNRTTYLPVEINGITTNSEIGIALTELQAGETLNASSSLGDISDKRYWAVDLASGSLSGAKITLPVEGDEGLDALKNNEFVVAFSETVSGDFKSIGRSSNSSAALVQNELSLSEGIVTLAVMAENQSIVVFNAISPNPDDEINNYIHIDNLVEGDVVSIYNRWGDLVFEIKNYNNDDATKRFNGQSNVGGGKDLPTGNYFYVIRRKAGKEVSGYLSLRK
jgi:gliding motility-associated-like protein